MAARARALAACATGALSVALSASPPAGGAPLLPDLRMGPAGDVQATLSPSGREQLRFSATALNVGAGPLELRAVRAGRRGEFRVQQRVMDPVAGPSLHPTAARLRFGGDGHGHWHVRDFETYELRTADGRVRRRQAKRGFCFFDHRPLPAGRHAGPREPVYGERRCGGRRARGLTMGLSVGWADRYPWSLPDQYIDVTGLPPGRYRLHMEADRDGVLRELDEANNAAWVDVVLRRTGGVPVAAAVRGTRGRL